jgi:hypothetical protein
MIADRRILATVRNVDDDGVGSTEERAPEALDGLVVQESLPPVSGDVFRDDDEGDRSFLLGRPAGIQNVEVCLEGARQRPIG